MADLLLTLLTIGSACGLVLSLAMHVVSFTAIQLGDNVLFPALTAGIFPPLISVILIAAREKEMAGGVVKNDDYWQLVLTGCPGWMKYMFWSCFVYAVVQGGILEIMQWRESNHAWRIVSAIWMAFYAMGLAVATAAFRRRRGR